MGIKVDYGIAKTRLRDAVTWADSDRDVTAEWEERSILVGGAPAISYTPMLGTGLLARATDDRLDVLALKETSGPAAYSARGLCHSVLVPGSIEFKFDLRTKGREPLNNQPFFRYDRVDEIERIRFGEALKYLTECLRLANGLGQDEALAALAAFIRVCIRRTETSPSTELPDIAAGLRAVLYAASTLLRESEGGKRVQAVTAAVFDVVFGPDRILSNLVNDPSRGYPGDVLAFDANGVPIASAEVRTKTITVQEIEQFAGALTKSEISRGMIVALSPRQIRLETGRISASVARDFGVLLSVFDSIEELIVTAFAWSSRSLTELLLDFPSSVGHRLRAVDASATTIERWVSLLGFEPTEVKK